MLAIAQERNRFGNVRFERGDLCDLPFPDGSIDIVTGGCALRNAPDLRKAVAEVRRFFPGGVAAFLDFANPENSLLRHLQYLLLRNWCGLWGLLLHGTPEVHGYIAESLREFRTGIGCGIFSVIMVWGCRPTGAFSSGSPDWLSCVREVIFVALSGLA